MVLLTQVNVLYMVSSIIQRKNRNEKKRGNPLMKKEDIFQKWQEKQTKKKIKNKTKDYIISGS